MSIPRCNNCAHWEATESNSGASGTCHRYPPMVLLDPTAPPKYRIKTEWPLMLPFSLCGEWKDREGPA